MKSTWFKLMRRFWAGLLAFVIIFSLLTWSMQPRPRDKVLVKWPFTPLRSPRECTIYSKDNRFVAILDSTYNASGNGIGYSLRVFDAVNREELFNTTGDIAEVTFSPSGQLLFLITPYSSTGPINIKEQLMLWDPQSKLQEVIGVCEIPISRYFEMELNSNHLLWDEYRNSPWSRLSPDAQTWLVPAFDGRTIWYDRIDIKTRKKQGRLPLPELARGNRGKVTVLRFTEDQDTLLAQTNVLSGTEAISRLHWINQKTGEQFAETILPTDFSTIIYATKDIIVAVARQPRQEPTTRREVIVVNRNKSEVRRIRLDEIQPEMQQRPPDLSAFYAVPGAQVSFNIDPSTQTLITSWNYYYAEEGRRPDTQRLPNFHFSIRDLHTGELIHSDCLKFPAYYNAFGSLSGGSSLVSVLPGPVLLVRHFDKPSDQFQVWLQWLQEKMKLPNTITKETLHFVEGRTGRSKWTLQFTRYVQKTTLSSDRKTLTVIVNGERYLYDYPLRQPWLLICSWALGVALVITLLTELRRWRKLRKDAQILVLQNSVPTTISN